MSTLILNCPKCGSSNCSPTFYTPTSFDCVACGNEWDFAKMSRWRRLKAVWRWLSGRSIVAAPNR